ncbi:MAG: methyltransferase domain-containing protein [Synechococcales cyanobacterium T60_A2020_003]|nr:methyltransferase domain-containing protein [Synechococcales cyanobacterium T60_A2020_003]
MTDAVSRSADELSVEFWEGRYQDGTTGWDLGQPAPAFVSFLQSDQAPKPGRIAVIGSGRGHDALWFAAHGFEVVGFDFAPSAIADARANATSRNLTNIQFLQRDIFSLLPEFAHQFDYVLEHTCFCAIAPELRPQYVEIAAGLLRPEGELIALFWAHDRPGGPPFGVGLDEIESLLTARFEMKSLTKVDQSPPNRANEEYLGRFWVR